MLAEHLQAAWYRRGWLRTALLPPAGLFYLLTTARRLAYRRGWLRSYRAPVPVVVVGNLTVGGTGKTPLVRYLAGALEAAGMRPGIVSRGYGGSAAGACAVEPGDSAAVTGDEPLLLARDGRWPVWIGRDRPAAVAGLLAHHDCDVVLSDDGLQHYALARDVEIAVVDAARRFGNGALLPAGPLREPASRLREVDLVAVNGGSAEEPWSFSVDVARAVNLASGEQRTLAAFADETVHAVAGIGHPQRFFGALAAQGIECIAHAYPDHHLYRAGDLAFGDDCAVLMTEKDAVKCSAYADRRMWFVPLDLYDPDGRLARAVTGAVTRARAARNNHDERKEQ